MQESFCTPTLPDLSEAWESGQSAVAELMALLESLRESVLQREEEVKRDIQSHKERLEAEMRKTKAEFEKRLALALLGCELDKDGTKSLTEDPEKVRRQWNDHCKQWVRRWSWGHQDRTRASDALLRQFVPTWAKAIISSVKAEMERMAQLHSDACESSYWAG